MSELQKHTELLNEQLQSPQSDTVNSTYSKEAPYSENFSDTGIFIRNVDGEWLVTCGNFVVLKKESYQECRSAIEFLSYELLFGIISAFIQFDREFRSTGDNTIE